MAKVTAERGSRCGAHWVLTAKKWLRPVAEDNPRLYRELRFQIAERWGLLQRCTWGPLLTAAAPEIDQAGMPKYGDDWRRALPALVLECAVRWAAEGNARTTQVRDAATRAAHLDSEITAASHRLADLICERHEITREHGLPTEWGGPNLDLWDLIDRAAIDYPDWAFVCADERRAFLRLAQEQSRPGPELEDVLREVRSVHPSIIAAVRSGDDASLTPVRGSALEGPAVRMRRFFDKLERLGLRDARGRHVGPLLWMRPKSIAVLLSALSQKLHDPKGGPFNEGAVRKAHSRYLEKMNASTDKLGW